MCHQHWPPGAVVGVVEELQNDSNDASLDRQGAAADCAAVSTEIDVVV